MATEAALRTRLAAQLERGVLRDAPAVAAAFRDAPRHAFVPGVPAEEAYSDRTIVTRVDAGVPSSSSTLPSVMALMLDRLAVEPGHRVLEIGTGTGYNAALLAELVGDEGRVTSVELVPELASTARDHLSAAGYADVNVVVGDGALGVPAAAPFDRIVVTGSCTEIAPAWIAQLDPAGRIVLPFRLNCTQVCFALRKAATGFHGERGLLSGFMPLEGSCGRLQWHAIAGHPAMRTDVELPSGTGAAVAELLRTPGRPVTAELGLAGASVDAVLWIGLHGSPFGFITRRTASATPDARAWSHSLLLLGLPDSALSFEVAAGTFAVGEVVLHGSPRTLELARIALERWEAQGRPGAERLRADVVAETSPLHPLPHPRGDHFALTRGAHRYTLRFDP